MSLQSASQLPGGSRPLDTDTSRVVRSENAPEKWVAVRQTQADRFRLRHDLQSLVLRREAFRDDMPDLFFDGITHLTGPLADMPPRLRRAWLCGRGSTTSSVTVGTRGQNALAIGNVIRCGRTMVCPTCAGTIREERRRILSDALVSASDKGLSPFFLTLTVGHKRSASLESTLKMVSTSWAEVTRSKEYRRLKERLGWIGFVSVIEITYGLNGWHPHLHLVMIPGIGKAKREGGKLVLPKKVRPSSQDEMKELAEFCMERWERVVRHAGGYALAGAQHWTPSYEGSGLSDYMSKETDGFSEDDLELARKDLKALSGLTFEVSRGDLKHRPKKGHTVFQLGQLAAVNDVHAARLWWEHDIAVHGLRWWRPSHHLWKILEVDNADRSDEEIMEDVEPSIVLARVKADTWWRLTKDREMLPRLAEAVSKDASFLWGLLAEVCEDDEWEPVHPEPVAPAS